MGKIRVSYYFSDYGLKIGFKAKTGREIETGTSTYLGQFLWNTFVSGRKILEGYPSRFTVEVSDEEERAIRLLSQTPSLWSKWGLWSKLLAKEKGEALKELLEVIAITSLKEKIEA